MARKGKNTLQLQAEITLDNKEAKAKLEETKQATLSFGQKVAATFKSVGGGIAKYGGGALAVGTAVVGTIFKLTEGAAENEKALAKVSTLLDMQKNEAEAYYETIKAGAGEAGKSVADYAEAVYSAISAGVAQEKAVSFVSDAVKLAKGGFTSTTTAVDILTTAINAYNLSGEDAIRVADTLIMTQNLGKTTVDELGGSMGKVIPLANSLNVSLEQLSAMYAQTTKNGVATAESGTQIKALFSELSKGSTTVSKIVKELYGKSFAELMEDGKTVGEVLVGISDYAETMGATLGDVFSSVEAKSAAMILIKNRGAEIEKILSDINSGAGATEEAFGKMADTMSDKIERLKNKFSETMNNWGEKLLPVADALLTAGDFLLNDPAENMKKYILPLFGFGEEQKINLENLNLFKEKDRYLPEYRDRQSPWTININIEKFENKNGESIESLTEQIAEELQRKLYGREILDNR